MFLLHTDDRRNPRKSCPPTTMSCRPPIQESGEDDGPTYEVPAVGLRCSSPSPQVKDLPVYYNVPTVAHSSQSALLLAPPSGDSHDHTSFPQVSDS